jgi:hypothetical protein
LKQICFLPNRERSLRNIKKMKMKNLKTIVLGIFIISAIAINVVQSLKRNVALACYPWDPNYNTLTGECDLPPSGEQPENGHQCIIWIYDMGLKDWTPVPSGFYERNCTWAVVGSCTEEDC